MWQQICMLALVGATGIQLAYWLGPFLRLLRFEPPARPLHRMRPVSVIICAKNEADNLRTNLYHFLNQNYRSFEVIVVNDNSTDDTEAVLLDEKTKSANLHVVCAPKSNRTFSKKQALANGLEYARFEWIVVSDADCKPASPDWLACLSRRMDHPTDMVLGYSPYEKTSGWLNRWIRFEGVWTGILYLSAALAGNPYMGVGRNMAYRREVYRRAGGFASHSHLESGDDDLFVNQMAVAEHTAIEINPQAFVWSIPKGTWRGYYYQKSRHVSTAPEYRRAGQGWLLLYAGSHVLHYALVLISAWAFAEWVAFLLLGLRWGLTGFLGGQLSKKLGQSDLAIYWPILDVMLLFYYVTFLPSLFQRRHHTGNR